MANKIQASTQKFTGIKDIIEDIVIFDGGNACLVVEVQATNFALLSQQEQEAKIYSYASLLNSLSFPIQVIVRNKKLDISLYLKRLDSEIQKRLTSSENPDSSSKLTEFIKQYRDFVSEMVKINIVLDKKFYMVIPFSNLEKGVKGTLSKDDSANQAKAGLHTKAESLLTQLNRLSLLSKILNKEELIKLFYEIYNHDLSETTEIEENIKAPIVRGKT